MKAVAAQTKVELVLTLRRGESLLILVGIPVGLLVFFSLVDVLPHGEGEAVDFLVPGVLALSVIASAMTSLGIATGFERHAGVLRLLGITPLGRGGLLVAKIVSLGLLVTLQVAAVVVAGLGLGWSPDPAYGPAIGIIALGTICFAAIGFLLAGRLRAETNLAAANGLFLVFLLLGGIIVPIGSLPEGLAGLAQVLPAEPLAAAVRATVAGGIVPTRAIATLGAWTVGMSVLAVRAFRWD